MSTSEVRFRLTNGSWTPWQAIDPGMRRLPDGAECIEVRAAPETPAEKPRCMGFVPDAD